MFTSLPPGETPLSAGACLRRITAALVTVTGGVLAWAAAIPAASAAIIPVPPLGGAYGPVPAAPIRVIAAGGMPGWQITLIAVAAALVAGTAAVFLDRARAGRRPASATR
ncbi:MAG TPA: hypothetical protein VG123_12345 [Streptosporangiaceae bacterium]|jgi:hypothetical protein|nr:hypothetical protein [Streptosporangiaceae bacterium]